MKRLKEGGGWNPFTNYVLIKQHLKKMAEIPQKCDFVTWSIQNFVRKVKQFVRKYTT